jgi:integrase
VSKAADGRSSIHRCRDGNGWEGWVSFGTDPATGARRRKHVRGQTKAEVDDKVKALETARDRGALPTGPDRALSTYLDSWVSARANVVRPTTRSGYRTDLLHVSRSGVGAVKVRNLTPEHIERIYAAVLDAGCGPGSVAHVRRTVSAALNTAARRGHIARNPVPLADTPRPADDEELEPYDVAEIAAVLSTARRRRNGVRWSLAFLGLRQGEALALRWDDVDLERGEARIRHTLTWLPWQHGCTSGDEPVCGKRASACPRRHGGGAHLGPPKSKAGRRTIAIPEPVLAELRDQRRRQVTERIAASSLWDDRGFIVTNHTGGPLDRTTDTRDWVDIVRCAGVRRLRLHDCRHSAATALLVLGIDARVLMATMGWTSMSLVQRYTHMVPELRRDVAVRQGALWNTATTR